MFTFQTEKDWWEDIEARKQLREALALPGVMKALTILRDTVSTRASYLIRADESDLPVKTLQKSSFEAGSISILRDLVRFAGEAPDKSQPKPLKEFEHYGRPKPEQT